MKLIWHILIISLFSSSVAMAQSPVQRADKIKSNNNYKWGEGTASTMEEASKLALEALIGQISVAVNSDYSESQKQVTDNSGVEYNEKLEHKLTTYSSAVLTNVSMIVLSETPEEVKVFRYIKMEDVNEAFRRREDKIKDFIVSGKKAEQRLQIDDALRYYYWSLALTYAYPYAVYINVDGENENAKLWLRSKINSIFHYLSVDLTDCSGSDEGYSAELHFKYSNMDIASIQYHYYDGYSYMGPNKAKDGRGFADFEELPTDKFRLRYELQFKREAENLDPELRAVFSSIELPKFEHTSVEIPVKTNLKKGTLAQVKTKTENPPKAEVAAVAEIAPEPVRNLERMTLEEVENKDPYQGVLAKIETAIQKKNHAAVKDCFTAEGYEMFKTLLDKTGKISITGTPEYTFLNADKRIIAKSIPLKIKFRNGRSFMEDLTFRFDPNTHKISSIAFALTKKAEDDIFKAAAKWSEISRYTIMTFMEDYQTAYALKRLDFIESIFSENAIIITGTVLKNSGKTTALEGKNVQFSSGEMVKYTRQTKGQFIDRLKQHFDSREYIHLTFEDNETSIVNTNGLLPNDAVFAIQIRQIYNSPSYSDQGYLTLMLNMQDEYPLIEVRTWQPERNKDMDLRKFIERFKF